MKGIGKEVGRFWEDLGKCKEYDQSMFMKFPKDKF